MGQKGVFWVAAELDFQTLGSDGMPLLVYEVAGITKFSSSPLSLYAALQTSSAQLSRQLSMIQVSIKVKSVCPRRVQNKV